MLALWITLASIGWVFLVLEVIALIMRPGSRYKNNPEQQNPMEGQMVVFVADENDKENADGVKGHLVSVGKSENVKGIYVNVIKRALDIIISFFGLIILSPVFLVISIAIFIDDPGPVIFTQKRVGKDKQYFKLHKFRSMKMSTPHDVPTHMLENPDHYITRIGRFCRRSSFDELVQIWDIFVGNLSIIGPRPALWNQDILISERDKYNANNVKPGLTGWAQINGRDELEIYDKAKLDGEYTNNISLGFDCKCFFATISSVLKSDGVVEGGTGKKDQLKR